MAGRLKSGRERVEVGGESARLLLRDAGCLQAGEEIAATCGGVLQPGFGVVQVVLELPAFCVQLLQIGYLLLEGGLIGQQRAQRSDVRAQALPGVGELLGVESPVFGEQEGASCVLVVLGTNVLGCGGGCCVQQGGQLLCGQGVLAPLGLLVVLVGLFVEQVEPLAGCALGVLAVGEFAYGAFLVAEGGQFPVGVFGGGGCGVFVLGCRGVQGGGPGAGWFGQCGGVVGLRGALGGVEAVAAWPAGCVRPAVGRRRGPRRGSWRRSFCGWPATPRWRRSGRCRTACRAGPCGPRRRRAGTS